VYGFLGHFFQRGQRDFASRSAIVAGRYDVLVTSSHLEQARALLVGGPYTDTDGAGTTTGEQATAEPAPRTDEGADRSGTVPPPRAGSQADTPASRRTP
jgi:hypothetical protein